MLLPHGAPRPGTPANLLPHVNPPPLRKREGVISLSRRAYGLPPSRRRMSAHRPCITRRRGGGRRRSKANSRPRQPPVAPLVVVPTGTGLNTFPCTVTVIRGTSPDR